MIGCHISVLENCKCRLFSPAKCRFSPSEKCYFGQQCRPGIFHSELPCHANPIRLPAHMSKSRTVYDPFTVFGSGFAIFQQGGAARRRTSRASGKSAEKQKNLLLDTPGKDRLM
jgi:hypothetical protein